MLLESSSKQTRAAKNVRRLEKVLEAREGVIHVITPLYLKPTRTGLFESLEADAKRQAEFLLALHAKLEGSCQMSVTQLIFNQDLDDSLIQAGYGSGKTDLEHTRKALYGELQSMLSPIKDAVSSNPWWKVRNYTSLFLNWEAEVAQITQEMRSNRNGFAAWMAQKTEERESLYQLLDPSMKRQEMAERTLRRFAEHHLLARHACKEQRIIASQRDTVSFYREAGAPILHYK